MNENMSDSWVLIILFALIFGGGSLFGGGQNATTQEILFGQQFQNLDNKIDRIGNGISDLGYALNSSIMNEGRTTQMQLANCCCENQRNVDALRYDIATMNAGLSAAIHGEGEQTRALIAANETQRLRDELAKAQNANSQFAQNQYLLGVMGHWVANPVPTT